MWSEEVGKNYIDSPVARQSAWRQRDGKTYCMFHPQIHPDNVEDIRLKAGQVSKKVDHVIEVQEFRYCPRCFAVSQYGQKARA